MSSTKSAGMKPSDSPRRMPRWSILLISLAAVAVLGLLERVPSLALFHLVGGWAMFLYRNLRSFTLDPSVVASLIVGTILSLLLLHSSLRWWHRSSGKQPWPWKGSLTITAFIFILFATSFIIPGIVTMLRTPLPDGITALRPRMPKHLEHTVNLKSMGLALMEADSERGPIVNPPEEFNQLPAQGHASGSRHLKDGFGASGYLFLAAGLRPWESDEIVPLIASPEYRKGDSRVRSVLNSDLQIDICRAGDFERLLEEISERHQAR